jgi:hypothetical protein
MLETGIGITLLQPNYCILWQNQEVLHGPGPFQLLLKTNMKRQQGMNGLHEMYISVYINFPYS